MSLSGLTEWRLLHERRRIDFDRRDGRLADSGWKRAGFLSFELGQDREDCADLVGDICGFISGLSVVWVMRGVRRLKDMPLLRPYFT